MTTLKKIALAVIIFFVLMAGFSYFLLKVATNQRINDELGKYAFPKTKSGQKLIWRLQMSLLVEGCFISEMFFIIGIPS